MRRLKRSTTLLQRSRDRFRSRRVAERTRFCEKNRVRTLCLAPKRGATLSVLGEKMVLAASVLDGQRNLGFLEVRLA
jgi:hypothetical protein